MLIGAVVAQFGKNGCLVETSVDEIMNLLTDHDGVAAGEQALRDVRNRVRLALKTVCQRKERTVTIELFQEDGGPVKLRAMNNPRLHCAIGCVRR